MADEAANIIENTECLYCYIGIRISDQAAAQAYEATNIICGDALPIA
ncbi:MAG: hypothetical protein ACYTFK_13325 [Planctomycetota bacterium]|jgi:hypothetical protein